MTEGGDSKADGVRGGDVVTPRARGPRSLTGGTLGVSAPGPADCGGPGGPRYTAAEFGELLGVSAALVRSWARRDLLPPVPTSARRAFGYEHLARGRALLRLHRHGWRATRIARALAAARPLCADDDEALAGIEAEAAGGGRALTVRLADGRRCAPAGRGPGGGGLGQGLFDFGVEPSRAPARGRVRELRSAGDWFQRGVEAEAGGRLDEAVAAYRRALAAQGGVAAAEVHFNLGNCLYQRGDYAGAAAQFRAAVALEAGYVEAWNNLGIACGALDRDAEALAAYRRALAVRPHYADAHYNLADALAARGDLDGARQHWRAYLTFDPNSQWADQVRRRLQLADGDAG